MLMKLIHEIKNITTGHNSVNMIVKTKGSFLRKIPGEKKKSRLITGLLNHGFIWVLSTHLGPILTFKDENSIFNLRNYLHIEK